MPRFSFSLLLLSLISPTTLLAQRPLFVTQTPVMGNSGNTFFIFLPMANNGDADATNIQLTSVALTHLGSPAATLLLPAALPSLTGSGFLAVGGVRKLDLEFDNTTLQNYTNYLLTIGGTYQINGTTVGFSLNRPVIYTSGFAVSFIQLLNTISSKFESLTEGDENTQNLAMLAFVKGLPQVSNAGIGKTSSVVWIQVENTGPKLFILNNNSLDETQSTTSIAPQPSRTQTLTPARGSSPIQRSLIAAQISGNPVDLPQSRNVRLLNGFGAGFTNLVSIITPWFTSQGYTPVPGADVTVDGLRNVRGDGVLYIASHGGADDELGTDMAFNIWTGTTVLADCSLPPYSLCPDPLLKADLAMGRVGIFWAKNHIDPMTKEAVAEHNYAIFAAKFARYYWKDFSPNAFVYLDICDGQKGEPSVQEFKILLQELGVSLYAGWTDESNIGSGSKTTQLIFDRLLGADKFCPENGTPCAPGPAQSPAFPQRAFDYSQVTTDLGLHVLGISFKAQLAFTSLGGSFGLLAPTISNMSVDEYQGQSGQLTINGIFGQDPRPDGSVLVGNAPASITSWSADAIVVDLPASGTGSSGDVQVIVRDHKSNVATLTDWRGDQFVSTIAGNGSLLLTARYNLHFRADIRKYRPSIHVDPIEPTGFSAAAIDSTGAFSASGLGPGIDEFFQWNGSGSVVYSTPKLTTLDGLNFFVSNIQIIDSTHLKATVAAASGPNAGAACNGTPFVVAVTGPGNWGPFIGQGGGAITLFNFDLDATTADIKAASPSFRVTGNSYVCMEDDLPATYSFNWGPVTATSPPDPESAR
jgi:hypothetical protein